jgi:hypothetical protein
LAPTEPEDPATPSAPRRTLEGSDQTTAMPPRRQHSSTHPGSPRPVWCCRTVGNKGRPAPRPQAPSEPSPKRLPPAAHSVHATRFSFPVFHTSPTGSGASQRPAAPPLRAEGHEERRAPHREPRWAPPPPGHLGDTPQSLLGRCLANSGAPSGIRRGSADFSTEDLRGACPPHICFWGPATPGPTLVPCFWPPTQLPPGPSLPSPWCFAPSRQPPAPTPGPIPSGRAQAGAPEPIFAWCPFHALMSYPGRCSRTQLGAPHIQWTS